ncbi:MAG: hypothetical protein KAT77_04920 [Nanoarchaeota archaeon]|nr:hypothetical protein [Nanoarchaeota archaeon]
MKKIIFIILFLLIFINVVKAEELLTLNTAQPVYVPGDTILISTEVYNNNSYQIQAILESLMSNQGGTYPLGIIPHSLTLDPYEKEELVLYNILVDENFISDLYRVSASLVINNERVATRSINFSITETLKEIEVDIKTCKDLACTEKSKIFIKNEKIYLDYYSKVPEPIITATLTLPDETTQQLTLPTSIETGQIGTYTLDITASKEGYKTLSKKEQFAVIEQEAQIGYTEVKEEVKWIKTLLIILTITIIIIALGFGALELYRFKILKKQEKTEIETYVQVNLQRGYTFPQIKKALLRVGWKEKLIDECFTEVLKKR